MSFWETQQTNKTVLIIPNYTFSKNLEKDSFVDVIYQHIKAVEGVQWILPVPMGKGISKLNLPNVRQVQCNISGNMIWMRSNFPLDVIKLFKSESYDYVYSHLPDWHVSRFTKVPIIGYAHWWEMKECNGESWLNHSRNIYHELVNILDWEVCYLNTQHQKEMLLDNARILFNDETVAKLDSILEVMHLSVNKENIVEKPSYDYEKVIVFNHRTETYKGWGRFYDWMKKYREHRQDFKVWAPLLDKPVTESWIDSSKYPKDQYYQLLRTSAVCVQPKQLHAGWSVSATDAMMNGCPVLFEEQDCYFEIDSNAYTFKGYKELEKFLDVYLDVKIERMEAAKKAIEGAHRVSQNDGIKKIQKRFG